MTGFYRLVLLTIAQLPLASHKVDNTVQIGYMYTRVHVLCRNTFTETEETECKAQSCEKKEVYFMNEQFKVVTVVCTTVGKTCKL